MSNQKEDKNKIENNAPDINSSKEKKERPVITLSNPNIKAININYKKQGKEENKKNGFNQKPSQSNQDKIDKLIDAI